MSRGRRKKSLSHLKCLLSALIVAGCGGGDEQKLGAGEPQTGVSGVNSDYSVKAYWVTRDADGRVVSRRKVQFGVPKPLITSAGRTGADDQPTGPALRPQNIVVEDSDGNETTLTDAYELTSLALLDCVASVERPGGGARLPNVNLGPPWSSPDSWFYFHESDIESCDGALATEEILLCGADKLAAIADAVAPVEWFDGQLVVPPQAERDKFIIRDQAINVLAHLVHLDINPNLPTAYGDVDCNTKWAGALSTYSDVEADFLFGGAEYLSTSCPTECPAGCWDPSVDELGNECSCGPNCSTIPYFPPHGKHWEVQTAPEIAAERIKFKMQLYRATGRLLKDLVTKSVRGDMAGAEAQRSAAADPLEGARLAWGVSRNSGLRQPNSLRHALRVLTGRLEDGAPDETTSTPLAHDPACKVYRSWAETPDLADGLYALGPGVSARWEDLPPTTDGEALAASLVAGLGLATPPGSNLDVRAAVQQLVVQRSQQNAGLYYANLNPVDPNTPQADLDGVANSTYVHNQLDLLDTLSDEELQFGVARSWDVLRQLIDYPAHSGGAPNITSRMTESGVSWANGTTFGTSSDQYIASFGVRRDDLSIPAMARALPASVNAQCGSATSDPIAYTHPALGDALLPFQGAFPMASALMRHLGVFAERLEDAGASSAVVQDVRLASAELRAWAGPGRAYLLPSASAGAKERVVSLSGVSPDWLPLSFGAGSTLTTDEVNKHLALVVGRPSHADCVAGLRKNCPYDLDKRVATANLVAVDEGQARAGYGMPGPEVVIRFEFTGAYANPQILQGEFFDDMLYLVQLNTPELPGASGRVLAAFENGASDAGTPGISIISEYQRQLLDEVFGIAPRGADESCNGVDSTITSRGYCIDGVERDMFVPLANELTSQNSGVEDSWRHYLTLAEDAARRADQLGNELIQAGLQRDLRREAAQEELGALCGDFLAAENLTVGEDDGILSIPDRETINACFDEQKFDIVFLGNNPFGANDGEIISGDALDAFRDIWCQGSLGGPCNPFKQSIEVAGLGFGSAPATTEQLDCNLPFTVASLRANGVDAAFGDIPFDQYASSEGLSQALLNLRIVHWSNARWALFLRDAVIAGSLMETDPAEIGSTPSFSGQVVNPHDIFPLCAHLEEDDQGAPCVGHSCCTGPIASEIKRLFKAATPATLADLSYDFDVGQKLSQAIWYMGEMAGELPPQRINMPVVAADWSGLDEAVVPTMYGWDPVNFVQRPTDGAWVYASGTELDRNRFGTGKRVSPEFASVVGAWSTNRMASGLPQRWLIDLYADVAANPDGYILTNRDNERITFRRGSEPLVDYITSGTEESIFSNEVCVVGDQDDAGRVPVFVEQDGKIVVVDLLTHGSYQKYKSDGQGNCNTDEMYAIPSHYKKWSAAKLAPGEVASNGFSFDPSAQLQPVVRDWPDGAYPGWAGLTSFGCGRHGPSFSYSPQACMHHMAFPHPDGWTVLGTWEVEDQYFPKFVADCESSDTYKSKVGGLSPETLVIDLVTQPQRCSPKQRLPLFVDRDVVGSGGGDGSITGRALALACYATGGATASVAAPLPPRAETVGDLAGIARWTKAMGRFADRAVDALFLESVPKRVVLSFQSGRAAAPGVTTEGTHGETILDLRGKLEALHTGWVSTSGSLRQLGNVLDGAMAELEQQNASYNDRLIDSASAEAAINRDLAMAAVGQMGGTLGTLTGLASGATNGALQGAGNPAIGPTFGAAVGGAVGLVNGASEVVVAERAAHVSRQYAERQRELLRERDDNAEDSYRAGQHGIFARLNQSTQDLHTSMQGGISQMRTATAEALAAATRLQTNENMARFEAAKAAGADYVRLADDSLISFPVNTVQNRQFGLTRRRYEQALRRAKRLAYMARLAIEQRVGVRLRDINEPVGALEAPSLWADEVCSLQGIDYNKLSTVDEGDSSSGTELDYGEFADAYIGDYVLKLRDFIEYYNIEFPFQEADDRAIVSLRERLLGVSSGCYRESKNQLFFSGDLSESSRVGQSYEGGWGHFACASESDPDCLRVRPMPPASDQLPAVAPPGGTGGVSWLSSGAYESGELSSSGLLAPAASVFQAVDLPAQTQHVLSWWDLGLASDGQVSAQPYTQPYQVAVYNEDWHLLGVNLPVPHVDSGEWSDRRYIEFSTVASGTHFVVFGGLPSDMNVAISNVQLERAAPEQGVAGDYEHTAESRSVFTSDCTDEPRSLQEAFEYRCEGGGCFYELSVPFAFDLENVSSPGSNVAGLIAAGNYNHRHRAFGLNIVGTGVLDCGTAGPNCYGQAFLEYDLLHDAYDVAIEDYGEQHRCFTFGTGAIRGAKALASERFLTTPMSSADQGLMSQPGFLRSELGGRPLSGNYRLRIIDHPALQWRQIEDIQLILDYRAWSRVSRTPDGF